MNNASMKNMLFTALLAVALCALPALAARDTYLLGTGRHGVLTVDVKDSKIINEYAQVKAVSLRARRRSSWTPARASSRGISYWCISPRATPRPPTWRWQRPRSQH
ncbi:hypothetical protein ACN28S_60435 [Cystobacter fuscus]